MFVDLSLRAEEGAEHCIPRCILSSEAGVLPIVNVSDFPLKIKAKQVVARAEAITEASAREINYVTKRKANTRELSLDEIKVGDDVPREIKERVRNLLNEFRDRFAMSTAELGKTNIAEMNIELTSSTPVYYRPYRLSYSEREKVKEIVDDLKKNEIIRDSNSPFASPILLVRKKNGEVRMCVDYRALNKITKKDRFPLPIIEDQINNLQGATRFTSLDAASCFYQIPVAEESIEKTAFVTPDGHFEFLRQPFGLVTAPAVCQRMAAKIIAPLQRKGLNIQAYIDDFLIATEDDESGIEALRAFLERLREVNITLRLDKCSFLMSEINFLGFDISRDGIRPGKNGVRAVTEFKTPVNVHEVRQFVGLSSYFRKFIRDYAAIARPLTMLTRKNATWIWGPDENEAFEKLKRVLISRPVLALYNRTAETELHTDASQYGLGGILMQRQADGNLHPVAFFSRQTTKEEQRYHSYELETLAVVSSLHRFRVYVLGAPFKIITDCSALRATFVKRDLSPRIGRWWIQLQEYDCSVEYRSGAKMTHVDALSRNPVRDTLNAAEIQEIGIMHIGHDHRLLVAQRGDQRLRYIVEVLQREPIDNEEREIVRDYVIEDNKLYRKVDGQIKWVVPRCMRRQVVQLCHDEMGHVGLNKTFDKLRADYWFPGMKRYARKYVKACIPCFYAKEPTGKKPGRLQLVEKAAMPMHTLHVDHLGPFVKSRAKNCYLIVAVDAFTKYVFMKAVANTKALLVERFLDETAGVFGYPQRLITDRGSSFTSKRFAEYCRTLNIKHVMTAVATPRANGQVERYNRTILDRLTAAIKNEEIWDQQITQIKWGLNNTTNKATGKSPSELLLGYRPRNKAEVGLLNEVGQQVYEEERAEVHARAAETIRREQLTAKKRFDSKRTAPRIFKLGDAVGVRRDIASNEGRSKKLLPKYGGPYEIKRVLDNDRYVIGDIKGAQRSQKPYKNIHPEDRLKLWELAISSSESDTSTDEDAGVHPR